MVDLEKILSLAHKRELLSHKQDAVQEALSPSYGVDSYFNGLRKVMELCVDNDSYCDFIGESALKKIAQYINQELSQLAQSYQEEIDKIENEITSIITKQEANDCGHHNNNDITPVQVTGYFNNMADRAQDSDSCATCPFSEKCALFVADTTTELCEFMAK